MSARQPVAVVGAGGRIGHLVQQMDDADWQVLPVTREQDAAGLDAPGPAMPILVCTRNHHLDAVVERVHPSRHPDLVFVQNGMVQPELQRRGLGDCTQGVLWVAVPKKGDPPVPGGASAFCGPWADTIARLLDAHGVDAVSVGPTAYAREVAVKLAWICVYGPLGSATGAKVGALSTDHAADARRLCDELHPILRQEPGLDLDADALFDRLQRYSDRIPHFPAAVKEWPWRNGWQLAAAARLGVPQPHLRGWLERAGIDPETGP